MFKPRRIWHAFWNAADEDCHLLELISPGEFANYFTDLAPFIAAQPPEFEKIAEVQARYALQMDLDSIPRLMAEHGLRA